MGDWRNTKRELSYLKDILEMESEVLSEAEGGNWEVKVSEKQRRYNDMET